MTKKIIVCIYAPIDAFPPTINLINEFIDRKYEVFTLEVANAPFKHSRVNVTENKTIYKKGKSNLFSNYIVFCDFLFKMLRIIRKENISNVVVFDTYGLFSFFLLKGIRIVSKDIRLWYHNHDIGFTSNYNMFSLGWLVHRLEFFLLKHVTFFSLPSVERADHFLTKAPDAILPNYPSIKLYSGFKSKLDNSSKVSIIFQGRITPGHGLESLIKLLEYKIGCFSLELVLKGLISKEYKHSLMRYSSKVTERKIKFISYTAYEELASITSSSQIGVAIFLPQSYMHSTLGTASNKIYEYVACGLPILYLDNEHFRRYLGKYDWAFPVKDNPSSIKEAIQRIIEKYDELSDSAKRSFLEELNYEIHFEVAYSLFLKKISI